MVSLHSKWILEHILSLLSKIWLKVKFIYRHMNNHRNLDYLIRIGKKYKETIFVDYVSGKN